MDVSYTVVVTQSTHTMGRCHQHRILLVDDGVALFMAAIVL